ncbi:hypothetical protein ACGFYZ_33415 [Streptomyces sp. NPDC048330]|uniref:hypothetical protein n=1 Tax=Streptomyces sp. NPDC048330 TaxID=3365533 RepID=UPI00371E2B36
MLPVPTTHGHHRLALRSVLGPATVLGVSGPRTLVACLRQALTDAADVGATSIRVDLTAIVSSDCSLIDTLLHTREWPARLVLVTPMPSPLRHLLDITDTTGLFHFEA